MLQFIPVNRLKTFAFCLLPFAFSFWLMFSTFSYDGKNGAFLISDKLWSDFGSTLPLIRSFSLGSNWPIQHPLFPGEPIRYHPLFYMATGLLEKAGLRLDFGLNILSGLGFFFVLVFIFKFGQTLFSSRAVAALAVVFFLFNGSLSFLRFFNQHPVSSQTLHDIVTNSRFPSFGPWDGGPITAFWNLNIYTNQRHLAPSFALALALIYVLYTGNIRYSYLTGFILGSFLLLNHAVFGISLLFVGWFFLFRPRLRLPLIISAFGFLPWLAFFRYTIQISPFFNLRLGYLSPQPVTVVSFIKFWLANFGLHLFLIPLGFLFSPRPAKVLVIPLLLLFAIPNLWQLSPDLINNHKFFNFFLILSNLYTAYFIVTIAKIGRLGIAVASILVITLTVSGIIDFFPIVNDAKLNLADIPSNPDARFFYQSTSPRAVVLNSFWFYHPASIAGRPIYNGYSYFTWSYGYDQVTREKQTKDIYAAPTKGLACTLLRNSDISYVELNSRPEGFLAPNWTMWNQEFTPLYINPDSGIRVFSVAQNCPSV